MKNNEYIRKPLQDLNQTTQVFPTIKKQSPYCNRVKEVNRRNSMLYQIEFQPKKYIMMCLGETQRINMKLKSESQAKKLCYKKPITRERVSSVCARVDISPWDITSSP
ncbi:hypothetical protein pb186bvf_013985 [Paramecium bursaria]